jgi:hypothetical protein
MLKIWVDYFESRSGNISPLLQTRRRDLDIQALDEHLHGNGIDHNGRERKIKAERKSSFCNLGKDLVLARNTRSAQRYTSHNIHHERRQRHKLRVPSDHIPKSYMQLITRQPLVLHASVPTAMQSFSSVYHHLVAVAACILQITFTFTYPLCRKVSRVAEPAIPPLFSK